MVITIRSRTMSSDCVDSIMFKLNQGFVPIIKKLKGYVSYYVIDSGNNVVTAISVFEDEATSQASNRIAEAWVKDNLGPMVPGSADIISGPVRVPSQG